MISMAKGFERMANGITVHMLVKNEEIFVKKAIESVIGIADEIIIFDTGSTDSTPEIIESINDPKIRFYKKGLCTPEQLVSMRNEMIVMTKTKWFFVVDGDEIFYFTDAEALKKDLEEIPEKTCRVEVTIRDFVKDPCLAARDRVSGKIWRTDSIKFFGEYPFEGGFPKNNPEAALQSFSMSILKDKIICYHMVYFTRSSKDSDVNVGRHWRRLPFPVKPFFGPYPEGFPKERNILKTTAGFFLYNLIGFFQLFFHDKERKRYARTKA